MEKKLIEIKGVEDSINDTLQKIASFEDFNESQENLRSQKKRRYRKRRIRHTFGVKELKEMLANAEFIIVSAGTDEEGEIKFCFQPIIKEGEEYYEVLSNPLSSYAVPPTHPINGIPKE